MAQGLAGSGNQRRYGATDGSSDAIPGIAFAGQDNIFFSPTELYNLCENITTNIYTINHGHKKITQELRSIGTPKDTQGLRDQIHVTHVSCNELVAQTTDELARLTEIVRRGNNNKHQKLQAERLREEFSQAVNNYCRAQKQISEKMKLHLPNSTIGTLEDNVTEDDTERLLAMERRQQDQKLKQRELEFEAGLMEERAQQIQAIENDIIDVNQIMRNLSAMVHQQGEVVDSIEDNVENVHGNVELGRQELQKAAGYQSKYRRKLFCLFMTAMIVATVLGIIIYVSVKR